MPVCKRKFIYVFMQLLTKQDQVSQERIDNGLMDNGFIAQHIVSVRLH